MANHGGSKIRVLAIYNMLQQGRCITASQILRELELHYGIVADRKTIYSVSMPLTELYRLRLPQEGMAAFKN